RRNPLRHRPAGKRRAPARPTAPLALDAERRRSAPALRQPARRLSGPAAGAGHHASHTHRHWSRADQLGLPRPALHQPLRRAAAHRQPARCRPTAARAAPAQRQLAAGCRALPPSRWRRARRPLPAGRGSPPHSIAVPSSPRHGGTPMTPARTLANALPLTLAGISTLVAAQCVPLRWDIRYDESAMLPVTSPSLSPGEVQSRTLPLPALTRLFLVGDDPRSLAWLEHHAEQLRQLGAAGLAVEVEDMSALERIRRRSEEHTSELQSRENLVCRLLLEK